MKNIVLNKFFFLFFALAFLLVVMIVPSSSISQTKVISVDPDYKQLSIEPLPAIKNKIDSVQIVIDASYASSRFLSLLRRPDQRLIARIISELQAGNTELAISYWQDFLLGLQDSTIPLNINDIEMYLLREGFLKDQAHALQYYASRLNVIAQEIQAANDRLSDLWEQELGMSEAIPPVDTQTTEDLQNEIAKLEEKLSAVGDDAQLANIDLQNMLQKQQQTLQIMSGVSKALHDNTMAIIRKMGG